MEALIFLSSPGSITPFHMDPEHNILLQIEGEKTMTVFPPGDETLVPAQQSECFHRGGHRNLQWDDGRSEEHTSELQSLMRTSYAVFCLKKKNTTNNKETTQRA